MSMLPTSRALSMPRKGSWLGLAAGLLTAVAIVAIDVGFGPDTVITTALVLAPFVAALLGTPRQTVIVGAAAVVLALVSGFWNDNFAEAGYFLRTAIVVAGGAVGLAAALLRAREAGNRNRLGVLMDAAGVVDDTLSLEETVHRLSHIVVPVLADLCIFEVTRGSGPERLGVRASGPRAREIEDLFQANPELPSAGGIGAAVKSGRAQLIPDVSYEELLGPAHDEARLEVLRSLGAASGMVVPLRARGRSLGSLVLAVTRRSRPAYGRDDLEFAELLAGRAGLALDNAGLFSELAIAEAQLTVVLGSLAEAVIVQSAGGGVIYANEVAAKTLGLESAEGLLATPAAQIADRFEAYREDGSRLRLEDLPGRRVLAGQEALPVVVRAVDRRTGEERWRITKATAVRSRDGHVQFAVTVIEDITEVKRAELAQRLLAQAGQALYSSLDYEHTLQRVAELAVPELADWCVVSMPDGEGCIRQVAVAHAEPEKMAFARMLAERYPVSEDAPAGVPQVIREGRAQTINQIPNEMLEQVAKDPEHLRLLREVGMRAVTILPLETRAGVIGALTLVSAESGRTFTPADVKLAGELARRAGAAVETSRLYTERSHIARTLQSALLPPQLPEMPGWNAATLYRAAGRENWVGGDFYDAFPVEGGWMLVVGDVVGHGPEAASLTAEARYTLRTAAMLSGSAVVALSELNRGLYERDPGTALCTAVCVTLREVGGKGSAEIVCAGHPLPLLLRDGRVEAAGRCGPMLGAWEEKSWMPVEVPLGDGDVLVLYTDGVIDAEGEEQRFGEAGLRGALTGTGTADEAVTRIGRALDGFEVGEQADDTAVLAVSRVRVAVEAVGAVDIRAGA